MLLGHHIEKMAAISIFLWIYRLSQNRGMPNNPVFETSLHIHGVWLVCRLAGVNSIVCIIECEAMCEQFTKNIC